MESAVLTCIFLRQQGQISASLPEREGITTSEAPARICGHVGADRSSWPYRPALAMAQKLFKQQGAKEKGPEVKFPWFVGVGFHTESLKDIQTISSPSSVIFLNVIQRPRKCSPAPETWQLRTISVEGVSQEYLLPRTVGPIQWLVRPLLS